MAKGPQLLLCIEGYKKNFSLVKGKVYTYAGEATCGCGKNVRAIVVEESPKPRFLRVLCKNCGAMHIGNLLPWRASRFIPLNDPDTKLDDEAVTDNSNQKKPTEVLATQGELGRVTERSSPP